MFDKQNIGKNAERKAVQYLQKLGFKIVCCNWHCRFGEIDIISKKEDLLLFAEVKFRSNNNFSNILYSIDKNKINKIKKSVYCYLNENPHKGQIRIDAIFIKGNEKPIIIENISE